MEAGGDSPCWCTQLPPLPVESYRRNHDDGNTSRCFCPDCLRALLDAGKAAPQKNP
jgi:hypothetical protein